MDNVSFDWWCADGCGNGSTGGGAVRSDTFLPEVLCEGPEGTDAASLVPSACVGGCVPDFGNDVDAAANGVLLGRVCDKHLVADFLYPFCDCGSIYGFSCFFSRKGLKMRKSRGRKAKISFVNH